MTDPQYKSEQKKIKIADDSSDEQQKDLKDLSVIKKNLPHVLTITIPFNPEDHQLIFYRESKKIGDKNGMIIIHGWRISEISQEQQDITLYCLSLLQSKVHFPLSFLFKKQALKDKNKYSKFIWLEATIMVSAISRGEMQENIEYSYYTFIKQKIIPTIDDFIKANITWEKMVLQQYSDTVIVESFQKNVIYAILSLYQQFEIGLDYSLSGQLKSKKKKKQQRMIQL